MISAGLLTFKLVFLVSIGASLLGASLAWSLRDSSNFISVLVGLPLVFSSFIYSFVFLSFFDELGFYELRSIYGLSLLLILNLTPYMFFSLRLGLKAFPESLEEALSLSPNLKPITKFKIYSKFLTPYWGTAFGFLSLEVLSDFGASFIFGQETLSVYVYNLWLEQYSFSKALPGFISLGLMVVFFFSLSLYFQKDKDLSSPKRYKLNTSRCSFIATLYSLVAVLFPVGYLIYLSLEAWSKFEVSLAFSSFGLSFLVALLISFFAFVLNKASFVFTKNYLKYPGLFYGVPGVLLGLAFYFLGARIGFLALIISLSLKFYKFVIDYLFSAKHTYSQSSIKSLNIIKKRSSKTLIEAQLALPFLAVGFLMVFVEVLKELPITLMLKPLSFNTLSTEIFTLVSEGDWELAAPYGLVIFTLGLIALLIHQFFIERLDYA